ncbi:MAG: molybdate transport system permease protein [Actinomycetota bacterium]|nr:molybdate transport system permease protein [Actinomycetota bacterium]
MIDGEALVLTARLAFVTCLILITLSIPLAAWLAYSQRRWTVIVEAVVALPLVLPPSVLGYYLLVAMGSRSPIGRWWESVTGEPLAFTFTGLVVASVLYSLPFAVQPLMAAFSGIDRRLLEASFVLGRGWVSTVTRVVLPLSRVGLVTAIVLTFAHTVGEFGVVLMVGGNIPGETRTASIAVYDAVQSFDDRTAAVMSLILLAFSAVVLVATYALRKAPLSVWPRT